MIINYIGAGLSVLLITAVCVWIFKQCWHDMRELFNSLDEPEILDIFEEDDYE